MTAEHGSLQVPLDALAAIGPVGVGVVDADLRYLHVDETLAAINGVPAAEHLGRTIHEVLGESAALVEPLVREALEGRATEGLRTQVPPPDGRRFVASFLPADGPDGPLVLAVVVEDHRERSALALRITEERLRLALEGTEVGFWEWDVSADVIRWSDNLGPIFGLPRGTQPADFGEFTGFIHPDDRERVRRIVAGALDGRGWFDEQWRIVRSDGAVRWVESRGHLLPDDDGGPLALVGITTDVTDRRRREERTAFLARATALLARTLDPEETLGEVVQLAVPELADACVVHLLDEEGRPTPATSAPAGAAGPQAPAGVAEVLASGASHVQGDRGALTVPLVARGQTLGTMTFVAGQGAYDAEDLDTAEALGRRAGLALDNARLHGAQQAAIRQLEAVLAVTDVGLAHLDLDDLLRRLLDRVREVTDADTAAILLPDEEGGGLRVVTSVGEQLPSGPERDLVEVPLHHDGAEIGVLQLGSGRAGRFGAAERTLLGLVAQRAAIAIAHARLYEQARDVAVTLQRSLLPGAPPVVAGLDLAVRYVPGQAGMEIGGDWYDVVALPDDRVVLIVGDVEGRGTAAAALMGRLRAVLRAYVFDAQGPADALTRLDLLLGEQPEPAFATVVLACVEADRRSMTVSCAGHPPPLVLSPGGPPTLVAVTPGVPVGAPSPVRTETTVGIEAGTRVLLYTDGLVERRDVALQDRLDALVAAATDAPPGAPALLDHVLERLGDPAQADDVALLAADVDPSAPRAVVRWSR